MATVNDLYPPNPPGIPEDLTKPTQSYRTRVLVVLACLMVFFTIYLTLTVGSAGIVVWCIYELIPSSRKVVDRPAPSPSQQSQPSAKESPFPFVKQKSPQKDSFTRPPPPPSQQYEARPHALVLFILAAPAGLLFLFLVRGFFRRTKTDAGIRLEVTEVEQPKLFAFIERLCQDTGAPFPYRVYLVPEVNAAVAFHQSVLNLILPARKNLIIGLGLINRLNLTEFKAVLAHEFGHFSQSSMKLGSYVYTANRVIADIVYGRGKLDEILSAMCRIDIRIAIFAWCFVAVLWVMREGLELLFKGIVFAHTSLSRQMEYNADLVAVSVTGSDALVFALARLDFANETLEQAWADLRAAADHDRFSADLYYHQTHSANYLRRRANNPKLGEVPELPDNPSKSIRVFKPEDTSVPKMWATHPANYDRETNAKQRYFRGPLDERSAWELFSHTESVREEMTRRVYKSLFKKMPRRKLEDPEDIQEFIDAEHLETTYDDRYQGFYDDRYIQPGDPNELCERPAWKEYDDPVVLSAAHDDLYDETLKSRMAEHKTRLEEKARLVKMASGAVELTGDYFEYRGKRYELDQAKRLLKKLEDELEKDFKAMHTRDRRVFLVHYAMAAQVKPADQRDLEERYRLHLTFQRMHVKLVGNARYVEAVLSSITGRQELAQDDFRQALDALREAHDTLSKTLWNAGKLELPALSNVEDGTLLKTLLRTKPLIRGLHQDETMLNGAWIGKFMGQLHEVIEKLARVLFKSLGGILALQERTVQAWLAKQAQ